MTSILNSSRKQVFYANRNKSWVETYSLWLAKVGNHKYVPRFGTSVRQRKFRLNFIIPKKKNYGILCREITNHNSVTCIVIGLLYVKKLIIHKSLIIFFKSMKQTTETNSTGSESQLARGKPIADWRLPRQTDCLCTSVAEELKHGQPETTQLMVRAGLELLISF